MPRRLNNDIVDARINGRSIKRIDNYVNSQTPIRWKCLIISCQHEWLASPNNVLKGTDCPKCAQNLLLNNQIIDDRIKDKPIKRVGNYINCASKIEWICLSKNCNYSWFARPYNILYNNRGCPNCGKNIPLTDYVIDRKLISDIRPIKRLGNVISNNKSKIEWVCLNCDNIWLASPSNVLRGKGCPICINKNERLVFDTLKSININFEYHKAIKEFNQFEIFNYRVDFYIPTRNIIIEYNGRQHYEPRYFGGMGEAQAVLNFNKQQNRDNYIRCFCKNNNINLIEIDGRKYHNKKLIDYVNNLFK